MSLDIITSKASNPEKWQKIIYSVEIKEKSYSQALSSEILLYQKHQ